MDRPDEPGPATDDEVVGELEPAPPPRRKRASGTSAGDVIGGALVGVDYQIFRATKPPAVLVESAKPVRGLSGEGGAMLSIDFPDDTPTPEPDAAG